LEADIELSMNSGGGFSYVCSCPELDTRKLKL